MHDRQPFEARLGTALNRWADQVPTEVDAVAFVRATRVAPAPSRLFWRPASNLRLVLVLGLLLALAMAAAALVGALPSPRTYLNEFTPTGSLAVPRSDHTATLLPHGRVLIVGGFDLRPPGGRSKVVGLASTELWDPGTGSFTTGPSLAQARSGHTATLLPDGRVLVVGGRHYVDDAVDFTVATAELWDPATGTFSPTGSLLEPRERHTATLLPDGRVLVIGGYGDSSVSASAEIWDPATGTFTPTGSLGLPLGGDTTTALPDGRVLIVGGAVGDQVLASILSWDPATGSFTPAGSLAVPRSDHTATLLPDGRVLIIGGDGDRSLPASAEIWDPATNTARPAGSLELPRFGHTATLLPDGRVLVVGGRASSRRGSFDSTELWDPATESFSAAASTTEPRYAHTATLLTDGRVLVLGGGVGPSSGAAELYH